MDLLDSPLNLAHQQSRKADRYVKAARYDEAIECHRRAAEYLTKAMAVTTIQQALESFSLQRESHIRQQALIREKQRRHLQYRKQNQDSSTSCDQLSLSRATPSDPGSSSSDVDMSTSDKTPFLRNIQETDSLLRFLNNRATRGKDYGMFREEKSEEVLADKDDKTIMEDLRSQNEALRNHFMEFMKEAEEQHRQVSYLQRELDYCRKENRDLKDRLSKTERSSHDPSMQESENFYSMPIGMNLDSLPALELPPLEMPKFDFDTMKMARDDDSTSQ